MAGGLRLLAALCLAGSPAVARTAPAVRLEQVGDMAWPRTHHACTLLKDGRVLVSGGSSYASQASLPWCEIFDPATRSFEATGAMAVPRCDHVAALLADGRVLVAGGGRAGYAIGTASAEAWSPSTGRFTACSDMSVPRCGYAPWVTLDDGRVLIIGGTREGVYGTATSALDVFDPRTNGFTHVGELQLARSGAGACRLDADRLIVLGGVYRCCHHPLNALTTSSQEILDLRTFRSELVSPSWLDWLMDDAGGGARLRASTGAIAAIRLPGEEGEVEIDGIMGVQPLDGRLGLRLGTCDVVDLRTGARVARLPVQWHHPPSAAVLRPGLALACGGAIGDRACSEAWLISVAPDSDADATAAPRSGAGRNAPVVPARASP